MCRMTATPDPPESTAERLTLTGAYQAVQHVLPLHAIEEVGGVVSAGVVSTWMSWEFVASRLPALSHARYFTVVVDEMLNVPL